MADRSVFSKPVSIQRWVEICCTQPARLYGLHERKGSIAPGLDADLVIWYPEHNFPNKRISNSMLHHDIGTWIPGLLVAHAWRRFN
jgi:dihydropyrimidinase